MRQFVQILWRWCIFLWYFILIIRSSWSNNILCAYHNNLILLFMDNFTYYVVSRQITYFRYEVMYTRWFNNKRKRFISYWILLKIAYKDRLMLVKWLTTVFKALFSKFNFWHQPSNKQFKQRHPQQPVPLWHLGQRWAPRNKNNLITNT